MKISTEYELNRMWLYEKDSEEPIGEVNFVVPADWLIHYWDSHKDILYTKTDDFDTFLAAYLAEEDGCMIYSAAKYDDVIICETTNIYGK